MKLLRKEYLLTVSLISSKFTVNVDNILRFFVIHAWQRPWSEWHMDSKMPDMPSTIQQQAMRSTK